MKKATSQDTKVHNTRLVLKTIYDRTQISRIEIARLTHLTRPTVSDIVADLTRSGLVEEIGPGPSIGGKRPILLRVADDSRCLLGIDLANSQFRGAAINLRGQIKHRVSLPIQERDGDAALALVYRLVDELVAAVDGPIMGIGIGTPGLMDSRQGVVNRAVNLDWENLPLGDLLEARYRLPTYIANDSQVAALAEMTFGAGKSVNNLIVLKVGRGVGAGIILQRQLYYGDGFGAGEIGHVMMVEGGELCNCGQHGCLETLASSRAIIKKAQAHAKENPRSPLNRLVSSSDQITTDVVLQAYEEGDAALHAIVEEAGYYLGRAVVHLVGALNIYHIFIAGSMTRFGCALTDPIRREVSRGALPVLAQETKIEISTLGTDVVLLGAAALILSRELGIG